MCKTVWGEMFGKSFFRVAKTHVWTNSSQTLKLQSQTRSDHQLSLIPGVSEPAQ